MPRSLCVLTALAIASTSLLAPSARAETTPTTAVSQLMVLEPGDSSYKLFHGAVWLDTDKATTNYRWGGLQCKGCDVSDASVQILVAAYRSGDQVKLEYVVNVYKDKDYR